MLSNMGNTLIGGESPKPLKGREPTEGEVGALVVVEGDPAADGALAGDGPAEETGMNAHDHFGQALLPFPCSLLTYFTCPNLNWGTTVHGLLVRPP